MDKIKEFLRNYKERKNRLGLRIFLVFFGVCLQGFSLYWLNAINFGTDPFTLMVMQIRDKVGISYGTTLLIFNTILFVFVLIFDRTQIGIGTLANMVIVGYMLDFTDWIMKKVLPEGFFDSLTTRIIILVPALALFIFAVGLYISVDLGRSPYDSGPFLLGKALKKVPFTFVRIGWDVTMAIVGILLGGMIGPVTVVMAFFIGPVITLITKFLKKSLGFK